MRLAGRILLLLAGASVPAVVAVIGCNVESDPYKGIGNEIPNARQGGVAQGGTPASASASSGSGTSSSSGSGGTAANDCTCAWSFAGHGDAGVCTTCGGNVVMAGQPCAAAQTACLNDANCFAALTCVTNCADSNPACTEACLPTNANYAALAACQCAHCVSACAAVPPLPCDLGDAGDGGDGG
jgi:hypothetical protein